MRHHYGLVLRILAVFILVPVLALLLWEGERWAWSMVHPRFRWLFLYVQVIVGGAGLGILLFWGVVNPLYRRHRRRLEQDMQESVQREYEGHRDQPTVLVIAAGSIARALWENLHSLVDFLQQQRLKAFLLVPHEDFWNARQAVEKTLGRLAHVKPSPVQIEGVAAGNVTLEAARSARQAEAEDLRNRFSQWARGLLKSRLTLQVVGLGNQKGYTSLTCFTEWPWLNLRELGGYHGEVTRWVFLVRDVPMPETQDVSISEDTKEETREAAEPDGGGEPGHR